MFSVVLIICWISINQCFQFFDPHSPHETVEECRHQLTQMTFVITQRGIRGGLGPPTIRDARCAETPPATADEPDDQVS